MQIHAKERHHIMTTTAITKNNNVVVEKQMPVSQLVAKLDNHKNLFNTNIACTPQSDHTNNGGNHRPTTSRIQVSSPEIQTPHKPIPPAKPSTLQFERNSQAYNSFGSQNSEGGSRQSGRTAYQPESTQSLSVPHQSAKHNQMFRFDSISNSSSATSSNISQSTSSRSSKRTSMEVGMDELRQILDKIERPSKEDNLKQVVLEIAEVEYSFCVKLKSMSLDYPKFIKQNSPKNKNLLTEYPIITKITQNLNQILNVHSFLLDKFVEAIENWKDNDPNIASIFTKQAGFLKMCTTFLGEKANYTNQLNAALEENEKLAELTRKYETELLSNCNHNAHKSSESMPSSGLTFAFELDSVHQNIVRYNLLMRRYQNALSEEKYPSEYEASVKAINNLQSVSQNVDHYLFQKAQKKRMLELCRRFPDGENLLIIPSRNLIHDGELIKQGRKDKLARYLILFDDVLLVCGISLLSNSLDNSKTKTYRLDEYQVECVEKIDYEREFKLLTNDKSNSFICDTKAIRDLWVKKLNEAQEQYIENKKNKEQLLPRQDGNGQTSNVETRNTTAAVWVSDKKSTTCMMIDCGSKFGRIIVRRHHCRKCGYLICSKCTGEAPVPSGGSEEKGNSVIQKVCPECFIEVKAKYSSVYEASKFRAPKNFNLKRMRYETGERSIIYEKVHRQDEVRRWAQMMDNCFAIYEAEMDINPMKMIPFDQNISTLTLSENLADGTIFVITDTRKNVDLFKFRVQHPRAVEMWKCCFESLGESISLQSKESLVLTPVLRKYDS